MKAIAISALSSGEGKTIFTMSLLNWLKSKGEKVRPFKIGPDYIDPQFHRKIVETDSVNLDLQLMTKDEIKSIFGMYSQDYKFSVAEGVMGFYDGLDYSTSTYDVTKALGIPTVLIVSAEASYITISAVIKGVLEYKSNNTIKAVILNKVSSEQHYKMVAEQIKSDIPDLKILGWIEKGLPQIGSRHLGLDLTELDQELLNEISTKVMSNINIFELLEIMEIQETNTSKPKAMPDAYSFHDIFEDKSLTVVKDNAFSFIYPQNIDFLETIFPNVNYISALEDDEIPENTDVVYIPGGYVETDEVAKILNKSNKFKKSLVQFSQNKLKRIFAECAGLMILGNKIETTSGDWIKGAGILPINFHIKQTITRIGYYKAINLDSLSIYRGHAFHYSTPEFIKNNKAITKWALFKKDSIKAEPGGWTNLEGNVFGTYIHSFYFNQPAIIQEFFLPKKII
jgi:cobyrinic acid a,c-diamide synthase